MRTLRLYVYTLCTRMHQGEPLMEGNVSCIEKQAPSVKNLTRPRKAPVQRQERRNGQVPPRMMSGENLTHLSHWRKPTLGRGPRARDPGRDA